MTPEEVQKIYDQVNGYVVTLDPNPGARGPRYMMEQISRTRGYLNDCSLLVSRLAQRRHILTTDLNTHQTVFDVGAADLLVNDHRVTRLPAIDDRRAMINMLQREEYQAIEKLKREIADVEHVEKLVKHRHRELESTMSAIRLQKSLVDIEVRAGAQYGNESDLVGSVSVPDDDELSKLFDEHAADEEDEDEGDGEGEDEGEGEPSSAVVQPEPSSAVSFDSGFDVDALLNGEEDEAEEDEAEEDEAEEVEGGDEAEAEAEEAEEESTTQEVVEGGEANPQESDSDPDVDNFLDGEDFSEIFRDL